MKKMNRLNLVLGFGLISSFSFGQEPMKTKSAEPVQRKEMKVEAAPAEKQRETLKTEEPAQMKAAEPATNSKVFNSTPVKREELQRPQRIQNAEGTEKKIEAPKKD